jgi:hypothetical protein
LAWTEVLALLSPLAAIADDLAASGTEALTNFTPRRLYAVFPSFQPTAPDAAASRPAPGLDRPADWLTRWPDFHLVPRTAAETSAPILDPLSATESPTLHRFRDAPQALAALVYELLAAHCSTTNRVSFHRHCLE